MQLSRQFNGTSKLYCMFAKGSKSPKTFHLRFKTKFLCQFIGQCHQNEMFFCYCLSHTGQNLKMLFHHDSHNWIMIATKPMFSSLGWVSWRQQWRGVLKLFRNLSKKLFWLPQFSFHTHDFYIKLWKICFLSTNHTTTSTDLQFCL